MMSQWVRSGSRAVGTSPIPTMARLLIPVPPPSSTYNSKTSPARSIVDSNRYANRPSMGMSRHRVAPWPRGSTADDNRRTPSPDGRAQLPVGIFRVDHPALPPLGPASRAAADGQDDGLLRPRTPRTAGTDQATSGRRCNAAAARGGAGRGKPATGGRRRRPARPLDAAGPRDRGGAGRLPSLGLRPRKCRGSGGTSLCRQGRVLPSLRRQAGSTGGLPSDRPRLVRGDNRPGQAVTRPATAPSGSLQE